MKNLMKNLYENVIIIPIAIFNRNDTYFGK